MKIQFREEFKLSVGEIFSYFETPADWARLYGLAGSVKDLGDGWYSIPLKYFPFPLVARNSTVDPGKFVSWTFRGFWKGNGEIRFRTYDEMTVLEGYEEISIRRLYFLSFVFERLFIRRQFLAIWNIGWKRLRKLEQRKSLHNVNLAG
jgi:hypothetical protein